jgi:hypothetical protein
MALPVAVGNAEGKAWILPLTVTEVYLPAILFG